MAFKRIKPYQQSRRRSIIYVIPTQNILCTMAQRLFIYGYIIWNSHEINLLANCHIHIFNIRNILYTNNNYLAPITNSNNHLYNNFTFEIAWL